MRVPACIHVDLIAIGIRHLGAVHRVTDGKAPGPAAVVGIDQRRVRMRGVIAVRVEVVCRKRPRGGDIGGVGCGHGLIAVLVEAGRMRRARGAHAIGPLAQTITVRSRAVSISRPSAVPIARNKRGVTRVAHKLRRSLERVVRLHGTIGHLGKKAHRNGLVAR